VWGEVFGRWLNAGGKSVLEMKCVSKWMVRKNEKAVCGLGL
jgi:hypothetical protein